MNPIIEILKMECKELNQNNSDYNSGFNDGAYTLWRYLFEPNLVPGETRRKIEQRILAENNKHL